MSKRFSGQPEYVINFIALSPQELREIMAQLGVRTVDEMIGRTDLLEINDAILPWKAKGLDYAKILYQPEGATQIRCTIAQDHGIDRVLDRKLIEACRPALEKGKPVSADFAIKNSDRTTGAMLSGEVCGKFGEAGLPEDTIHLKFKGVAGQSFGAWLARGMTFELEGMANDYVGKGISGGKMIIYPDQDTLITFRKRTSSSAIPPFTARSPAKRISAGMAGERFCIRNSGLIRGRGGRG